MVRRVGLGVKWAIGGWDIRTISYTYAFFSILKTMFWRFAFPFGRSAFQNVTHIPRVESRVVAVSWARRCVFNNMSLSFAASWFCVLGASEPQIEFHGQ